MAVQPDRRDRAATSPEAGVPGAALEALAAAAASADASAASLQELARVAAVAAGADVAVVRTVDPTGRWLVARAVASASEALAAELEGERYSVEELPADAVFDLDELPPGPAGAAARLAPAGALLIPLRSDGSVLGSLELLRRTLPFEAGELAVARLAGAQLTLVLRTAKPAEGGSALAADEALRLAGDALAAGADEREVAEQVARLAAEATGADQALLWRVGDERDHEPVLLATHGVDEAVDPRAAVEPVLRTIASRQPVRVEEGPGLPGGAAVCSVLLLGQPPLGALELLHADAAGSSGADLSRLAGFGVRAAHALRASQRAEQLELELERSRALLAVVGQAIAELSLAHTLETAVESVAELLAADRLAIYLRDDGHLAPAAGQGLAGPHARVAEQLLELALGPFRGRGLLVVENAQRDPLLERVRAAVAESGIAAAVALPLGIGDEVIGLLAVYPERGRRLTGNEGALLRALAAQLAVAVQNARLHEDAMRSRDERQLALQAEQQASRRLRALYEVSRTFAESLRLDETLDALARSVVGLLDVDAAVIHAPSDRPELLEPAALAVRADRTRDAIRGVLWRQLPYQPDGPLSRGEVVRLDQSTAAERGPVGKLLIPFLRRGSTALVVPVRIGRELLATVTLVSLDPAGPIDEDTVDVAVTIAGQAALAVDNARLYQQQKDFADTMQRSLLPSEHPQLDGLELGDVYASSARLEVGGDVYDYVVLEDGRLAVALGDVTGHGIDATADMAMAKFVFRTAVREHPEPADFLAFANEVVVEEVQAGKFVTMAYVIVDPKTGAAACGLAGHPPPRLVAPDGTVRPLRAEGLPLGIDSGETFGEVRETLEPGASLVLYTDGVIEARRERELYGEERLDALLARNAKLEPEALAKVVLADCRGFAGELGDDCAVVVIRRTA
jgi:serine phosphatase RsbU (regulator of sigma subunit)